MSDHSLAKGDFVYQSDQELFLVCIGEDDTSYQFAVHGWRTIDKERLDEYISHDNGKIYKQDEITNVVENKGEDSAKEHFTQMLEMFQVYEDADLSDEGPHTDFALEDT